MIRSRGNVTETHLGPLFHHAAKPVYWLLVVVTEHTTFIERAPSKENEQLMLKRPKLLDVFQARVFKLGVRVKGHRMCDQLLDFVLIGWW